MAVFKLQLEEFSTTNFELIAIHTSLEVTKLAFVFNKNLNTKFRFFDVIDKNEKKKSSSFDRYVFDDHERDMTWNLLENKSSVNTVNSDDFLMMQFNQIMYLVPEFKQADFILKIDSENKSIDHKSIVNEIKKIKYVSMTYVLDTKKIKTKSNLIF
ncbi:MAG TPA: IPExxxVDY family protein [Flavobacterium sp.]|nr:IPExxxVDY family protein [Flavobacterium sp.]